MKRRGFHLVVAVLAVCLLASTHAFAQGGGASTTGSINGKVADSSGGVLPGVTVNATSPSSMGVQTSVTDTGGYYRFPALPPGSYTVTYELPGFNTLKRENIQISMGFTATVNVELAVASLQETVTVTGDSPVIDTSSTRVQQNFKLEQLQEIPNSRDLWSLLAVTPGVGMGRIDVGGSRAGTQVAYTAYGFNNQNRVLVEGINTTEGTSGAGFYVDYGSFEEVFLGTIAQGAEMPTPGVQSQMLGKSGGNKFQGEIYDDFESNGMISDNIAANLPPQFAFSPTNAGGVRDHSNETTKYRDTNINVGGPIKKDKVWWYFSYRNQTTAVGQPNFIGPIAGELFNTNLWNPSGKTTIQLNQNNKLIGYYQWGQKVQPNRLPQSGLNYTDLGGTLKQISGSWIYKGEWNGTVNNNMFVEARYGVFGYYFPLLAVNSTTTKPEIFDNSQSLLTGADELEQTDRQRKQMTGSMTYFKDGMGGTHNFKVGGEMLLETGWYGYTQVASNNMRETIGSNGAFSTVSLYAPTATHVGSLGDGPNGNLLSVDKVTTYDAFVTDQWSYKRATMNLGLRFDHYDVWTPSQSQLPYTFQSGVSIAAATFPEQHYLVWNSFVPRLGVSYDLTGDGKTVLKANYGLYRFNPGVGVAANANTNQAVKSLTYSWTDTKVCATCKPGDGLYEPGEETALTSSALAGTISVDPAIKQPYSTQATLAVERQLSEGVGMRVGYVYYTVNNQINTYQPLRPASAYSVPFNVVDKGPDNVAGTADDQNLTFYGIPTSQIAGCTPTTTTVTPTCAYPTNNVVSNAAQNGVYKTVDFSLNKRMSNHYSANLGFGYTWSNDYPLSFPNTPNGPFNYDYRAFGFKATGQYQGPWGISISPVFRFQAGANFARTLSAAAASTCACTFSAARGGSLTNTTVYATQFNANTQDNLAVFDARVEKTVNLPGNTKVRLFLDGFNLLNNYAADVIVQATGATYLQPTGIIAPRTARVGFRFIW